MFSVQMKIKMKRIVVYTLLALTVSSCGEGTSTGNPLSSVTLKFGAHSVAKFSPINLLIPNAYAALTQADLCFKRLRFKISDTDANDVEDNVDIDLQHLTLNGSGSETTVQKISIPAQTYSRVEFDLEDDCSLGYSVRIDNDVLGSAVTTTGRVTIKFKGTFTAEDTDEVLTLGIQNIIDVVKNYNGAGGNDLRDALEAVSGTF